MTNTVLTAIAWYSAEDWPTIKARATDSEKLHDSYADWLASAMEIERTLRKDGRKVVRVLIAPDALTLWCSFRGVENNGEARTQYAAEIARKQASKASR